MALLTAKQRERNQPYPPNKILAVLRNNLRLLEEEGLVGCHEEMF